MMKFGKYFCSAALLMMLAACSVNDDSSGDDPVPPERYETVLSYFKEINAVPRPSRHIAVKVLLQMKQQGLTQKALAERMNCTQQNVSKILKGKENMSLDTLTKLEDALGICLIFDETFSYSNKVAEDIY